MNTSPFAPPKAAVEVASAQEIEPPSAKYYALATALLFIIHLAVFVKFSGIYVEFVRTGVIHPLGLLLGAVSDIALLLGVLLLVFKRHARLPFLIAGVGSLLAGMLLWNMPFDRMLVVVTYGFGAAVACLGWWAVYRIRRKMV